MRSTKFTTLIRTMAIALVVAMVYYFAGYRLVYSFVMHGAKQEAAFAIDHGGKTSTMTLSNKQYAALKWTDKNKEFSFDKQLYDVISIKNTGSSYILQVYADDNETKWVEAMDNIIKFIMPFDHNKNTSQAEILLSAFQKANTPNQGLRIIHTPAIVDTSYPDVSAFPSSLPSLESIWHPPANS